MRAMLLVIASGIGSLGWGGVLPYQYAYAADTRDWGAFVAAAASSLFSIGALVAAPIAGRLSDRFPPVRVAVATQLIGAAGAASLMFADAPAAFLAGMLVFGLGLSAAAPAKQVLALQWSSSGDRRRVFAYKFTGESLGMAAGAFLAGHFVDLDRPDGLDVGFLMAAAGFVMSSAIIAVAGRGAPAPSDFAGGATGSLAAVEDHDRGILRIIVTNPALRWTAVVTIALALGFYAQFESGLPAYGITVLGVDPITIGTAAAVNCLVIVAIQVVVVRLTAKRSAPVLLMAVGAIWVLAWLGLSAAQLAPGVASAILVMTYGIFAVGETIYSPVLNPLTASLAPKGMVGRTLGAMAALQTAFTAAGPLVAGVLLGAGLVDGFLVMHLAISALAVVAAWRVHRALAAARVTPEPPFTRPVPVAGLGGA
ncbi:MFS transporter [Agromyces tardus]|uniref:MFS transporter n=1 Tax=Agromyces tardus TaxID=2583849 RepID=A0A3M8AFM5_9MICO|nr:MFS transporter [Agromyces tardus]RNB49993.1 MFS transporter [Agromyces tardus]